MSANPADVQFLSGCGAAGERIAAMDWSAHPLGPISGWPPTLRTALSVILGSGFPAFIAWGERLDFFHNDAYAPILGARLALGPGIPLRELWPDAWDTIHPVVERALAGEPSYFEDMRFDLTRNGDVEPAWFTFSYSPIRTPDGDVGGMLCIVNETTEKVAALEQSRQSEARLQMSLDASRTIGTWSYDPETNIAVVDARFARLFQIDAATATGGTELERFTNMIHPADRDRVVAAIGDAIAHNGLYDIDYRVPQRAGHDVWINARGQMFDDLATGGRRFAGVAVDITERKRAQDEMHRSARMQALQLRLADTLRPLTSPTAIIDAATSFLGEVLGVARVFYVDLSDPTGAFVIERDWTRAGVPSVAGEPRHLDDFGPEIIATLRAGESLVQDDILRDPRTSAHADAYRAINLHAQLVFPLIKAGQLTSVLALHETVPRKWTDEELQLARDVAQRTWHAVESAHLQVRLRRERNQSRAIFDSMAEGFALLDGDGTILQINEIGARLAGRTREALAGNARWNGIPAFGGGEVDALYRRVRASGQPEVLEHRPEGPEPGPAWMEFRAYPQPGGQLAVFFRDISERKRIEFEQKDENRRKDDFLAMLAHELRNPLAPIRAASDLLCMPQLDAERIGRTSAIIARQVRHMTSLVDDLLDVSRVTRGLVTLEQHELDAKRIVADAVEQVRPLMEARRHEFQLQLPPGAARVCGDAKRLVQVVANLLNNAVKYTPEGGHVALRMDLPGEHVRITVNDDGIGMSPETERHAFELFAQAERSSDRTQGGLGLGLALARSLTELHGGTVSGHSRGLGQGSSFTVCLPRLVAKTDDMPSTTQATPAAPARALDVLVVDDNVDAAGMLALFLEVSGHRVAVEHDATAALARARSAPPDVCLLDIGLPDIDGNELARRLRRDERTRDALLVAVTGYGQPQDRLRTAEAGFDAHLVKPVDTVQLARMLADVAARPSPG